MMTEKTRIHLIRHGEVARQCYNGQFDVALTPLGVEQYHGLKPRLDADRISACYTSDLSRTVRGGEIIWEQIPSRRAAVRAEAESLALKSVTEAKAETVAQFYADHLHDFFLGAQSVRSEGRRKRSEEESSEARG